MGGGGDKTLKQGGGTNETHNKKLLWTDTHTHRGLFRGGAHLKTTTTTTKGRFLVSTTSITTTTTIKTTTRITTTRMKLHYREAIEDKN